MRPRPPIPFLSFLVAVAVLTPVARTDGGRIPVWATTTISAPGHYYLTRDITASPPVITITSPDVVLDLNGHTITSLSGGYAGVLAYPPSGSSGVIAIRRGRIRGGYRGVWYAGPSNPVSQVGLRLEDLDISTPGESPIVLQSARFIEIVRCSVHDSPQSVPGIWIEAAFQPSVAVVITDSVVTNVGGAGIQIDRLTTGAIRNTVVDRWATATVAPGISIEGPGGNLGGALIEGNTLRGSNPSAQGIVISANAHRTAVRKNVLTGSMAVGVLVQSNGNAVTRNVVGVTGARGISVPGHDNTLYGNQVTFGSGNGIEIGGLFNLVDTNTVEGNGGYGLAFFGSNNVYRGNMLRNNNLGSATGAATDGGGNIL